MARAGRNMWQKELKLECIDCVCFHYIHLLNIFRRAISATSPTDVYCVSPSTGNCPCWEKGTQKMRARARARVCVYACTFIIFCNTDEKPFCSAWRFVQCTVQYRMYPEIVGVWCQKWFEVAGYKIRVAVLGGGGWRGYEKRGTLLFGSRILTFWRILTSPSSR